MAVTLTDEMRAAVHEEDCLRLGHDVSFDNAVVIDPATGGRPEVGSKDPAKMPHMLCRRCGRVWLTLEDFGFGYADAEAKLKGRLKDPNKPRG